jgi:hypothetical protein
MSELERALVTLGAELDVPEAPDLAARVLGELDGRARRLLAHPTRGRLVLALAVVLLAMLAATLAVPDARSALLRFLHIGSERIEFVEELPPVSSYPTDFDLELALGERVSLSEARSRAGFDLLELPDRPDRVYLGGRGSVWFVYGRPGAIRLLVAQTPELKVDETFILKKLVGTGTRVDQASVRRAPAYFLSGDPHEVLLVDEANQPVFETARLARDVLVWEEDGRTVRLEGDLTLEKALDVADSMR